MTQPVPGKALGKREPLSKPALMLRDVLTGEVPKLPRHVNHFALVPSWELGANDTFGTCGPTSVANHLRMVSTYLGSPHFPGREDVFDLYRRSGNPGFNPDLAADDPNQDDNGVYMQQMLEALLRDGIGGYKPVAFAKIAPGDMDTLVAAIAIFGGVLLGLELHIPQQSQSLWDYVPDAPDWGGHAVMAGRYRDPDSDDLDRVGIITWAERMRMTRRFVEAQEDEAWVVIWPEHLSSEGFLAGVDYAALASAYQDLTGSPFPAAPADAGGGADPAPPTPAVGPEPGAAADPALAQALRRYLSGTSAPQYLRSAADPWLAEHPEP